MCVANMGVPEGPSTAAHARPTPLALMVHPRLRDAMLIYCHHRKQTICHVDIACVRTNVHLENFGRSTRKVKADRSHHHPLLLPFSCPPSFVCTSVTSHIMGCDHPCMHPRSHPGWPSQHDKDVTCAQPAGGARTGHTLFMQIAVPSHAGATAPHTHTPHPPCPLPS